MNTVLKKNHLLPTMNAFFDDFFAPDFFDWKDKNFSAAGSTLPSVNVRENNEAFCIELAAPGMRKEDFKIELDKNLLTISGEHQLQNENENEQQRYTRREFSYQSFSRSFRLPAAVVEADKIAARYEHGILHVSIPKKEAAKPQPAKTIAVQ